MTERLPSTAQSHPELRRFGRGVAGYALGFLGLGAALSGSFIVGPAIGSALMWGSRRVLHKNYDETDTRAVETKDKLKRAAIFVGGLAVTSVGADLVFGGVFNAFNRSLNPVGRLFATALGLTTLYGADKIVNYSYDPARLSSAIPVDSNEGNESTAIEPLSEIDTNEDLEYYSPGHEGYMEIYQDLSDELAEISADQNYANPRDKLDDVRDTIAYYRDLAQVHLTHTT